MSRWRASPARREFYGRLFSVDPHVLDPRPDTETLIEAALADVAARGLSDEKLSLLDLGTGTGCILITLLAELPRAHGIGIDRSPAALANAMANARRLGVGPRASFIAGNWLDALEGEFDLDPLQPALSGIRGDRHARSPTWWATTRILPSMAAPTGSTPIGGSPPAPVGCSPRRGGSCSR